MRHIIGFVLSAGVALFARSRSTRAEAAGRSLLSLMLKIVLIAYSKSFAAVPVPLRDLPCLDPEALR
jgi:hypothetical protein